MEEWQKLHIQKNLVELCKSTICDSHLVSKFIAARIISRSDAESIELPRLTCFEKSRKLYEILMTRTRSYDALITSLQETSQTGAARILKERNPIFRSYGSISFDKTHVLGTGRSGTKVFKGLFGSRDVAVKVLNADVIDPEMARYEVDFLKAIDSHENIVRFFFAETYENFICIALELCVISLQDEMRLHLLNVNPVKILKECTSGVTHLHKHNIIHRDLKPANILLNRGGQVKISDFGLSKQIPLGMTSVNVHSGVVGSADWLAPEVLQYLIDSVGKYQLFKMASSADIFSLGCIFYFVLTN